MRKGSYSEELVKIVVDMPAKLVQHQQMDQIQNPSPRRKFCENLP